VVAILKYARKHAAILTSRQFENLSPVTLREVISEAYPQKISRILCKYVDDRTGYYAHKNDSVGENEIYSEDKNEVFNLISFV
jgi:stress response protein YsnF